MRTTNFFLAVLSIMIISLFQCDRDAVILSGNIRGTVTDAVTSEPLDSVTVGLNQANNAVGITTTNSDGAYVIKKVEPGFYEITASKPKYAQFSLSDQEDIIDTVNIYLNGLLDQDGNYYKIVTIGTQTWLGENLNTGTMRHFAGHLVLADNGEIEKYCYANNKANCDVY